MGAGESRLDTSTFLKGGAGGVGFHVLQVAEGSPAAEAGIEAFFDFVVGVGGQSLTDDVEVLTRILEESEGKLVVLQIWSSKRQELRDVRVIPSRKWSDSPSTSTSEQPSLLGLSLRLCNPEGALEQVWHVLDVLEGSPAESAGLIPYGDWIVGYVGGVLRNEADFYDLVEAHIDKPLRLFVYNIDYDVTREVIIVPNRNWGSGEGLLGCGVGYGLLHRIPKPSSQTQFPSEDNLPEDDDEVEDPQTDTAGSNGILASEGVSVVETFVPAEYYDLQNRPVTTTDPTGRSPLRPPALNLPPQTMSGFNNSVKGPPASPSALSGSGNRGGVAEVIIEEDGDEEGR